MTYIAIVVFVLIVAVFLYSTRNFDWKPIIEVLDKWIARPITNWWLDIFKTTLFLLILSICIAILWATLSSFGIVK